MGLAEAEDIDFKYTTMNLKKVYEIGMRHALLNIVKQGGSVKGDTISIRKQPPLAVKMEKSFEGLYPIDRIGVNWSADFSEIRFEYEGTGFVLKGESAEWNSSSPYVYQTQLYIDDVLDSAPLLPAAYTNRRYELAWKYQLPRGKHQVRLKILNPQRDVRFRNVSALIYSDRKAAGPNEKKSMSHSSHN